MDIEHLISQLRKSYSYEDLGVIVHVGAGACTELPEYLDLNAKKIVLVEALPDLADKLSEQTIGLSNVVVLNRVLCSNQSDTFYKASSAQFSSLVKEKGVEALLPNVEWFELQGVHSISLDELSVLPDEFPQERSALILQLNGAEQSLLTESSLDLICKFDFVIVQQYKHVFSNDSVVEELLARAYDQIDVDDSGGLYVSSLYSLNQDKLRFKSQESEFQKLTEAYDVLKAQNGRLGEELAVVRANLTSELELVKASSEEYQQKLKLAETSLSEASQSAQRKNAELVSFREKLALTESSLSEVSKSIQGKDKELASCLEKLTLSESSFEELNSVLNGKKVELEGCRVELEEKCKLAKEFRNEVEQSKNLLASKESECSLLQQMLAKSQCDLDDLRSSYSKKCGSEKELIRLVSDLREKLQLASNYYFRLQSEHPELLKSEVYKEVEIGKSE